MSGLGAPAFLAAHPLSLWCGLGSRDCPPVLQSCLSWLSLESLRHVPPPPIIWEAFFPNSLNHFHPFLPRPPQIPVESPVAHDSQNSRAGSLEGQKVIWTSEPHFKGEAVSPSRQSFSRPDPLAQCWLLGLRAGRRAGAGAWRGVLRPRWRAARGPKAPERQPSLP